MLRQRILFVVLLSFFSNIIFAAFTQEELANKFSEAQRLATQGQLTQAITVYQSIIHSSPLLPEAYNNLAAIYLQQKKTKQAKHILEQGLHAHKGYGVLYENLTKINIAMASEAYSKALQFDLKPSVIKITSLSLSNNSPLKPGITKSNIETESIAKIKVEKKQSNDISYNSAATHKIKNGKAIERILQAWSAAWSAQAVDMYLSFYHKQYKPSNGLSLKGWEQSRRYRLKKPRWIKIALSDFKIEKNTGSQAIVNFKQSYQSNSFSDVSFKQLVLLYTNNGWKIFREKSL